jgi:hypothetical protein
MGIDIKAALGAGMSPRDLHERVEAEHRRKIVDEIASGKRRCPKCREPMKLKDNLCILYCDRIHTAKEPG